MQRELLMGEVILRGGFRPSTADSLNRALSPELIQPGEFCTYKGLKTASVYLSPCCSIVTCDRRKCWLFCPLSYTSHTDLCFTYENYFLLHSGNMTAPLQSAVESLQAPWKSCAVYHMCLSDCFHRTLDIPYSIPLQTQIIWDRKSVV